MATLFDVLVPVPLLLPTSKMSLDAALVKALFIVFIYLLRSLVIWYFFEDLTSWFFFWVLVEVLTLAYECQWVGYTHFFKRWTEATTAYNNVTSVAFAFVDDYNEAQS